MKRFAAVVATCLLAAACASNSVRNLESLANRDIPAPPFPEACSHPEMSLNSAHALDTYFDSARAVRELNEVWPSLEGSLLAEVRFDPSNASGIWSAVTDIPSGQVVVDLVTVFSATQRDVALPEGQTLRLFLGDERGAAPRAVEEFGECPAILLGTPDVTDRLLFAADKLEEEADLTHVLAIHIDHNGWPVSILYQGDSRPSRIVNAGHAAVLASARFRPALLGGVPVDSWVHLANVDVSMDSVQSIEIAGLESRLWARSRGPRVISMPTRVAGGIPCGGAVGASQYSRTCNYNPASGQTHLQTYAATGMSWDAFDGPADKIGQFRVGVGREGGGG